MQDKFMQLAVKEAQKAEKKGEIPVGAVIIKQGNIIAKAHNLVETKKCALFHAEILAIKKASKKIKNWRLLDCELYVTLEPCNFCKNAISQSRIRKIYYSTSTTAEEKNVTNSEYIKYNKYEKTTTNILKSFFKKIR